MKWFILLISAVALSFLIIFITGHCHRTYATFSPSQVLSFKGREIRADELAQQYKPRIFLPQGFSSPPLLRIWYEVIPYGNQVVLVYHACWQDEIHPLPIAQWLYKAFRAVYYGYPTIDVEFIQVNLDVETGEIVRIRFESGPEGPFDRLFSEHLQVIVEKTSAGSYTRIVKTTNGDIISIGENFPLAGEQHLNFGIQTWNHLLLLLPPDEHGIYTNQQVAELEYLSDSEYALYKFCRKSQGDFAVKENRLWYMIPLLIVSLVTLLPFVFQVWKVVHRARAKRGNRR